MTVTQLNKLISDVFTINFASDVNVTGEISNLKISNSHAYFIIKDESSSINAIIWKYSIKQLNFSNGDKISTIGKLSLYNKTGSCNLIVNSIEKAGVGELYKKYIDLKTYYQSLNYFDNKKIIPNIIINIGIATSIEGAALQDFLFLINKNNYIANIKIKNCVVQGVNCPKSVAQAIKVLDDMHLDIIIIMRGGGSFEDLMGFSDQIIIEAIHDAKTFIISAIGHEIDHMLSDFVADLRAPTPSIAAEMIMKHNIIREIEHNYGKNIVNHDNNNITDLEGNKVNFDNIQDCKKLRLMFSEGEVIVNISKCLKKPIINKSDDDMLNKIDSIKTPNDIKDINDLLKAKDLLSLCKQFLFKAQTIKAIIEYL